jgi:hypothetical protein
MILQPDLLPVTLGDRRARILGDPPTSRVADALYLSIANWTTLGAGDLLPPKRLRLAAALEALTGTVSIALAISLIWLWCEETLSRSRKYVSHLDELGKLMPKPGGESKDAPTPEA